MRPSSTPPAVKPTTAPTQPARSAAGPGRGGAHFDAPPAGSRASATVHRPATPATPPATPRSTSRRTTDVPAGEVPLIPLAVASQQVHGMPRKRGIFGAEARIQREMRTVQLHHPADPARHPGRPADQRPAVPRGQQPHRPCAALRLPAGHHRFHAAAAGRLRLERQHPEPRRPLHRPAAAGPRGAPDAGHLPGAERHRLDRRAQHRRQPARARDRPAPAAPGGRGDSHEARPGGQRRRAGPRPQAVPRLRAGPNTVNVPVLARLLRGMH